MINKYKCYLDEGSERFAANSHTIVEIIVAIDRNKLGNPSPRNHDTKDNAAARKYPAASSRKYFAENTSSDREVDLI
jgi:hypothetical protein